MLTRTMSAFFLSVIMLAATAAFAEGTPPQGEELYKYLSQKTITEGDVAFVDRLNALSSGLDWSAAKKIELTGNLRILKAKPGKDAAEGRALNFIRSSTGDMYVISLPAEGGRTPADYEKLSENRMIFSLETLPGTHDGRTYTFARIAGEPKAILFDRIFKISIVLMLFFVMVGMGLTLKLSDFTIVFTKPLAIVLGVILQYGLMPLVALGLSHLFGFYHAFPFIYLGLILATASPAGVTSNLLTHFAKGDLALSISLTSVSTVLALFCTPLLLSLYGTTGTGASVPAVLIAQTIVVLVILPLAIGMTIRARAEKIALKAAPVFSVLGIITVLFIMVTGVVTNLGALADTERYSITFYFAPLILALTGMVVAVLVARLFRVSVKQLKSLAFETGVRNSALSMTLAILIQDQIGDFYSSLFIVNGVYGLEMYIAGILFVLLFRKFAKDPA
ncbi:MAG TPA: bile acid:sodium symporter family protein [Spirochaetota bacterium]|nr:bile acid:sodium symporter family protein [Spirochaetota bacterium]HOD14221.1 bile acid:sodium symporter family protein [Spirochaetota bacterium]HPG49357.1 bile acid:sodium symporter family protein [Spirochaetota bacterium]HPN11397.1 bile acid:sodium symporter family protein [Spirochaetota bacterium]HQL81181.1 bile acid:sodium symporter family protein [Spirochaetota bacterium]